MKKRTKIILIVVGSVLIASSIGIVIYQLVKKSKEDESDENPYIEKQASQSVVSSGGTENPQSSYTEQTQEVQNRVEPSFDEEGQLSSPLSAIKNRMLYPKSKSDGGYGYSNVRSSAEVNNDTGFFDYGNLLTSISAGTPIGRVISEEINLYNGFPYRWLKVKLVKPVGGWFFPYKEAFVRADTVTFKSYSL